MTSEMDKRGDDDERDLPPWQFTVDFTIKGTEEECIEKADRLIAYARRIGVPEPFCESEPNCDLGRRGRQ